MVDILFLKNTVSVFRLLWCMMVHTVLKYHPNLYFTGTGDMRQRLLSSFIFGPSVRVWFSQAQNSLRCREWSFNCIILLLLLVGIWSISSCPSLLFFWPDSSFKWDLSLYPTERAHFLVCKSRVKKKSLIYITGFHFPLLCHCQCTQSKKCLHTEGRQFEAVRSPFTLIQALAKQSFILYSFNVAQPPQFNK